MFNFVCCAIDQLHVGFPQASCKKWEEEGDDYSGTLLLIMWASPLFPRALVSSSSSSSIYEIFNISSIMGFFFFFKHLWNPQHFFNFIIYQRPLSSSQVPLCFLTCLMFFFFYLLQMFNLWEAANSLHLANSLGPGLAQAHVHLRHPWNPCFWGKGKSCTSFSKDMWAVSAADNWVRV